MIFRLFTCVLILGGKGLMAQSVVGPTSVPTLASTSTPGPTVSVASKTSAQANPQVPAFVITRNGETTASLTVNLIFSAAEQLHAEVGSLPKSITLPIGAASVEIPVQPNAFSDAAGGTTKTINLSLAPAASYTISGPGAAVSLVKRGATLFVAALRPTKSATDSTGYGTATLLLAENGESAKVAVSYSNLTSTKVSSHLKLGAPGADGRYVINFYGDQQPINFEWSLRDTGDLSRGDLQKALEAGLIYVAIDSKHYPAGELRGQFIRSNGSIAFTPSAPPPGLKGGSPAATDAARLLIQATFGPTKDEIDELTHKTFSQWINEQLAQPVSSHAGLTRADFESFPPANPKQKIGNNDRQAAWWKVALTGKDQLRQRVAFALSEILVVSDVNDTLAGNPEALAGYYDMLARDAFGSFRRLLDDVTFSPVMGVYLSHLKNAKADPLHGISPDENYAREVMQLFTIGLNQLQPDGTLRLDNDGLPIPTYQQDTIVEMAKVFTGFGFYSPEPKPNFRGARANFFDPMMLYPDFHDTGPKVIVGGIKLPPGQSAANDVRQTLDALFQHPNTAPFISRQLIQRLVTSNPSPGYVYRVAQVFAKNGLGERGDLGAVVRAILLDYEARSPAVTANFGFGKLKEPLLRTTALLRAFSASAKNGRFYIPNPEGNLGEAALRSSTVFNFFEPDYVLPGALAAAGLHAPEYQIFTATTAITVPNQLQSYIYTPATPNESTLTLKLDSLLPQAKEPGPLLDELNLLFCGGSLSALTRTEIESVLAKIPPATSDLDRARTALQLVVTSTDAAIQR